MTGNRTPIGKASTALQLAAAAAISVALAGCVGGPRVSFPIERPAPLPAVQPPPPVASTGGKPTVEIMASDRRVRDAIIERAQSRGTTIVGENNTGVTLEAPLRSTTQRLADICGEHVQGRVVRIYLATIPNGPRNTTVTEERFIIDPDQRVCAVVLTSEEIAEATTALGSLKSQAERPPARAAQAPTATAPTAGGTSFDPRPPPR
jgi:hypothetical protein